jgi:membrane-bound ClpP family serine protease
MNESDEFLTAVEQVAQEIANRPIPDANEFFEAIHKRFVEIQYERIQIKNQEMRDAKANLRKL